MGKRTILASGFEPRKCARIEQPLKAEDEISRLPDEVLVHMLSFLKLKEAARTSILSKRWIHLWKSVSCLNFDASKVVKMMYRIRSWEKYKSFHEREILRYIEWVNKVLLQSHISLALDSFRVAFRLGPVYGNEIDKWLQYAFSRRVQRLELDLSQGRVVCCSPDNYTFPYGPRSGKPMHCKSLRTLSLKNVNVSGQVLEFFLHTCPLLEQLLVHGSSDLINLQVSGSSLALRFLEIRRCFNLESIIVRDTNLVSLKTTEAHRLVLQNAPMLVDVQLSGFSCHLIRDVTSWLSCCFSKLESLTLFATQFEVAKERGELYELPQFTNLRQFVLVAVASKDDSLIGFTSLISASPNLEKFVLKLQWWNDDMARGDRELKKGVSFPLQRLKVVELLGYYGRRSELELVEYFLENAIVLKKLIIDPRDQRPVTWSKTRKEKKQEKLARIYAKQQLEGLIPSHIEFVIQSP